MMIPDKEIILNSIVKRDHVKQEKPGKTAMAVSYDLRLCVAAFFSNKGFLKVCFLSFFSIISDQKNLTFNMRILFLLC